MSHRSQKVITHAVNGNGAQRQSSLSLALPRLAILHLVLPIVFGDASGERLTTFLNTFFLGNGGGNLGYELVWEDFALEGEDQVFLLHLGFCD